MNEEQKLVNKFFNEIYGILISTDYTALSEEKVADLTRKALGQFEENYSVRTWLIWSNEHSAWWKPNQNGYTTDITGAGRYAYNVALEICKGANAHNKDAGVPNETMIPFEASPKQ